MRPGRPALPEYKFVTDGSTIQIHFSLENNCYLLNLPASAFPFSLYQLSFTSMRSSIFFSMVAIVAAAVVVSAQEPAAPSPAPVNGAAMPAGGIGAGPEHFHGGLRGGMFHHQHQQQHARETPDRFLQTFCFGDAGCTAFVQGSCPTALNGTTMTTGWAEGMSGWKCTQLYYDGLKAANPTTTDPTSITVDTIKADVSALCQATGIADPMCQRLMTVDSQQQVQGAPEQQGAGRSSFGHHKRSLVACQANVQTYNKAVCQHQMIRMVNMKAVKEAKMGCMRAMLPAPTSMINTNTNTTAVTRPSREAFQKTADQCMTMVNACPVTDAKWGQTCLESVKSQVVTATGAAWPAMMMTGGGPRMGGHRGGFRGPQ